MPKCRMNVSGACKNPRRTPNHVRCGIADVVRVPPHHTVARALPGVVIFESQHIRRRIACDVRATFMCNAGMAYTSATTSISSRVAPPASPLGAASKSRMPTPARRCRLAGAAIAVACDTVLDRPLGCVASSTPERGCCAAAAAIDHASGGWAARADFTVAARARPPPVRHRNPPRGRSAVPAEERNTTCHCPMANRGVSSVIPTCATAGWGLFRGMSIPRACRALCRENAGP